MLNIARHFLKEQHREEVQALRRGMAGRRKPLPRFWKWLGERHPRKASLWKFRRRIPPGMEVRQYEFPKIISLSSPYMAYHALVRKKAPEPMDDSRRDAMTALWMRAVVIFVTTEATSASSYRYVRTCGNHLAIPSTMGRLIAKADHRDAVDFYRGAPFGCFPGI
jgi:hypothetical protein